VSHKYLDLIVCQKARAIATAIDRATRAVPKNRDLRCDVAIPPRGEFDRSNIAAEQGRLTEGEFCRFLGLGNRVIIGIGNTTCDGCLIVEL